MQKRGPAGRAQCRAARVAIKNQRPPRKIRSRVAGIRLREAEWAALQQFAAPLGQPPSRIIRRLIREAITSGPDYFTDELLGVARLSRELAAIGRNLNQLAIKSVVQRPTPALAAEDREAREEGQGK